MTLIKSISGIRGTIGGKAGDVLSPLDIVKFVSAYGKWVKKQLDKENYRVVVGRDARISGPMVHQIVNGTLMGVGIDVIDIGLATTPSVEMAVTDFNADGGIILTASHNPVQWNALKLLNAKGEFITANDGKYILDVADNLEKDFEYADVFSLGNIEFVPDYLHNHIQHILNLDLVDVQSITEANFTVAIDCVNSVGGPALVELLKKLGVKTVSEIYTTPDGIFPHNPEPLPENLKDLSDLVIASKAHVGFAVDPDVDRLVIVCEDGSMFGEEYTLVAIADYVLSKIPGNTVSNLSSSRALRDITEKHNGTYYSAAVGELHVVTKMKAVNAVIGGEGNGGIILPDLHYGRDSLVGIALFLTFLAENKLSVKQLKDSYPKYYMSKNKIELSDSALIDKILQSLETSFASSGGQITTIDGLKIDFEAGWVHLRKSNTEPIIRIYSEGKSQNEADQLAENMIAKIKSII